MADNQDIPMWIKVVTGVILFAIAIGGVAWSAGGDNTAHSYIVDSLLKTDIRHDALISKNAEDISIGKEERVKEKIERIKLDGKIDVFIKGQEATVKEMTELKTEFKSFTDYLRQFDYDKKKELE